MRFRQWIKGQRLTDAEVGRRLGVSRGNIYDLANHRYWPTKKTLIKIHELTEGQVTPNDFFFDGKIKVRKK